MKSVRQRGKGNFPLSLYRVFFKILGLSPCSVAAMELFLTYPEALGYTRARMSLSIKERFVDSKLYSEVAIRKAIRELKDRLLVLEDSEASITINDEIFKETATGFSIKEHGKRTVKIIFNYGKSEYTYYTDSLY